jgi:zinc protease
MNPARRLAVVVCLAVSFSAQQLPDRSAAPRPGEPPRFTPPPVDRRTLSNGLPVWIVELHKVPVVEVSLVIKAGASADRGDKAGTASLTADLLDEGAGNRGALEIADAVDYLGATVSTDSSFDWSAVSLHVPVARLPEALGIMADVALRPTFPDKELQRIREERLTSLLQAEDDPEELAGIAFPRLLYGNAHRYALPATGTAAALRSLTAADLRAFHRTFYVPGRAALIVAGDTNADAVLPHLESAFGAWSGTPASATTLPAPAPRKGRQVFLIDKPDAAQSQITIGGIGVARSTPDYFAIRVLNTVLGGAFTSRLNTNLREEHGYAYGANSDFAMRLGPGPFIASAGVQSDKTVDALREFFKELDRIHQPIPQDELDKAKNYLALQLPRGFETSGSIAASLATAFLYDLPNDYFATYSQRVRTVTAGEAKRAADRYIQMDKLTVVIVGDRKAIETGVRALKLGPLRIVTPRELGILQ